MNHKCSQCGADVLELTLEKNDGICAMCRKVHEEEKKQHGWKWGCAYVLITLIATLIFVIYKANAVGVWSVVYGFYFFVFVGPVLAAVCEGIRWITRRSLK